MKVTNHTICAVYLPNGIIVFEVNLFADWKSKIVSLVNMSVNLSHQYIMALKDKIEQLTTESIFPLITISRNTGHTQVVKQIRLY